MKKNLITVLILALVVVNLVLTAILAFSIVPATKNANKLITEVAGAINLELSSGKASGEKDVSLKDTVEYNVNKGEALTINLKKGTEGKDNIVVLKVTLLLSETSKDYKTYGETKAMEAKDQTICNEINNVIKTHTKEEMQGDTSDIQDEILDELQTLYDSDFIVSVGFGSIICQ